jgi:hypothetical protein
VTASSVFVVVMAAPARYGHRTRGAKERVGGVGGAGGVGLVSGVEIDSVVQRR